MTDYNEIKDWYQGLERRPINEPIKYYKRTVIEAERGGAVIGSHVLDSRSWTPPKHLKE